MLMRIYMRNSNARILQLPDLGSDLGFNLLRIELSAKRANHNPA